MDHGWRDDGSLLHLPGPVGHRGRATDGMEGFARTFLGWSFLEAAGTGGSVPGARDRYLSGLVTGVRRSRPRPEGSPQTLVPVVRGTWEGPPAVVAAAFQLTADRRDLLVPGRSIPSLSVARDGAGRLRLSVRWADATVTGWVQPAGQQG